MIIHKEQKLILDDLSPTIYYILTREVRRREGEREGGKEGGCLDWIGLILKR